MTKKPRLCIDCRWCYVAPHNDRENACCQHPNNYQAKVSLVTGELATKYIGSAFCSVQRIGLNECGEAGKFWEPSTGDGARDNADDSDCRPRDTEQPGAAQ